MTCPSRQPGASVDHVTTPVDPTTTSAWLELAAERDGFSPDLRGWFRDDSRRARQLDRRADRDGDADLRAANERLAALAELDEKK